MVAPPTVRAALALVLTVFAAFPSGLRAQARAAPISQAQNAQTPYLFTGRLTIRHGNDDFFGTATLIRRYTGLTCGHLLFSSDSGFSTNLIFDPHYYLWANPDSTTVSQFGVLSGYQAAATADGDSDAAFARDFGYILFTSPAPGDAWADWQANPDALTRSGQRLVLGYAAETFPGTVMASVISAAPYELLQEGLYESRDYYTQSGMSGGPVYLFDGGIWQIFAETVAGTSPPEIALSDVRAITAEARTLLIDPEYVQGLVKKGSITGPSTVALGSNVVYKIGVVYVDGKAEWNQLPPRYSELKLIAGGPNKAQVMVLRKKTGKYKVNFGGLARGQTVELRVLRDTAKNKDQTPLARLTVTVQ